MPLKLVVFDAVGTLLHPRPSVAAAYAAVGRRHGSRLTAAEIETRFGRVWTASEERLRGGALRTSELEERERWRQIVAQVLDDVDDPRSCFDELYRHFAQPAHWQLYRDAERTLPKVAARLEVALASNFDERLLEIVAGHPVLTLCDPVVVSSRIGYRKPHPEFFRAVLRAAGVAPSETLLIGDDPLSDVAGARRAGWHVAQLTRRPAAPQGLTSLDGVLALIDEIVGKPPQQS